MGENRLKNIGILLAGVAIGVSLIGPVAQAAEQLFRVTPSNQSFYVDGRKVALEAYAINGYNYIKLRDIGQAVGFDVSYDPAGNAVLIATTEPYSAESTSPVAAADYSSLVSPTIFTETLTKGAYNGIRDSIVHRGEILAGSYAPVPLTRVDSPDVLASLSATVGLWPSYQFKRNNAGKVTCQPRYTPATIHPSMANCRRPLPALYRFSGRVVRPGESPSDGLLCVRPHDLCSQVGQYPR